MVKRAAWWVRWTAVIPATVISFRVVMRQSERGRRERTGRLQGATVTQTRKLRDGIRRRRGRHLWAHLFDLHGHVL